jgi:hypothetical protein
VLGEEQAAVAAFLGESRYLVRTDRVVGREVSDAELDRASLLTGGRLQPAAAVDAP